MMKMNHVRRRRRLCGNRPARAGSKSCGFTLIELLVVVAIIALLISILLPALNGARLQSKQTLCHANMKSLGEAAHYYARDNRDMIVRAEGTRTHFVPMLLRYLGHPEWVDQMWDQSSGQINSAKLLEACQSSKFFNCPTFPVDEQPLDFVVNAFVIPYPARASDRAGEQTGSGPRSSFDARRQQFTNITRLGRAQPANLFYVIEAHQNMPIPGDRNSIWAQLTDVFAPEQMAFGSFPRVANDQRHPRGVTAMFFDSHAEVIALRQVDPGPGNTLQDRIRGFSYDEAEWR